MALKVGSMSYSAVSLDISSIEQLIKLISRLPPPLDIRSNVVEVAEATTEGYVVGIAQVGLPEDEDAVLEHPASVSVFMIGGGGYSIPSPSQPGSPGTLLPMHWRGRRR